MDENPKNNDEQKKPLEKKLSVILILIIIIAVVFVVYFNFLSASNTRELTNTFSLVTPEETYDIIKNFTGDLTIVDIRPCECNYEN